MRMCVSCRQSKPKKELIRIVKNKEGEVRVDTTGKMNGRGAYICADAACLEKAYKNKLLSRILETDFNEEMFEEANRVILRREIER
jgi:hypothetical protein